MNTDRRHKLNIHVNGDRVSETVFPNYFAMMDAARAMRDEIQTANPGGFVVCQYQKMGEHGWYHGAILS